MNFVTLKGLEFMNFVTLKGLEQKYLRIINTFITIIKRH